MGTPRHDQAAAWAGELTALGIPTYTDPRVAAQDTPCVLIAPPALGRAGSTYDGHSVTWRFLVLARGPASLAGWKELDDLLDRLTEHVPYETAEPGQYALTTGADPVACYVAEFTE